MILPVLIKTVLIKNSIVKKRNSFLSLRTLSFISPRYLSKLLLIMKKYLLLVSAIFFIFTVGFSQVNSPVLDIDWELIPTPGGSALSFAEKDGRMWIANGRLYFSDDEGLNWQEHSDLSEGNVSYQKVYATDIGIVVISRGESSTSLFFSNDNGATFTVGGGYSSTTDPNGPGGSSGWFDRKSENEIIGIYYETDELLGENYSVIGSSDHGETWQSYPHLTVGYTNGLEMTLDEHNFYMANDTIVDLIEIWNTQGYKITLTQSVDTTFTFDFTMPENISSFPIRYWYHLGKTYMYHQDSFLVASSNFGETWQVVPSPDGSLIDRRSFQFTDAGIYWHLTDGLWVTRYDDWENPEFVFETNSTSVNTIPSENYNCYSIDAGVYLQSPTFPEPELRENGILGSITSFDVFGQVWWITSKGILLRSTDEGITWERESSLIAMNESSHLAVFEDFENVLYAYNDSLIYVSTDDGIAWAPISNLTFGYGVSVEKNSEGIYFYGNDNVLFSTDGIAFVEKTIPEASGKLTLLDNKLYLLASNRRYVSIDNGTSWSPPEIIYGRKGKWYRFYNGQLWSENYQFGQPNILSLSNDFGKNWIDYLTLDPIEVAQDYYRSTSFTDVYPEIAFAKTHAALYVTCNIGHDFGRIQGPFNRASPYTDVVYPIPQNNLVNGDFLYGYDSGGRLYRTFVVDLKAQLSDTVLVENQISGFLYKDDNDNCIFDEDDRPVKDKVITVGARTTTTDSEGWYGVFHTSIDSIDFYTDSLRHHIHNCEYAYFGNKILNSASSDTLSIAFNPIPNIVDGGVTVFPRGVFRPNGTPGVSIVVSNYGTDNIENELVNFKFNPDKQSITGSATSNLVNDSTWQISIDLLEGEEREFYIPLLLSQGLSLDDTLYYQIEIPITEDPYLTDNTLALAIPVLSSFDPNDKTVFPANTPRPGKTTELVYRIRFQNTGTDTAFNVTVIDTLSENLNVYSLKMLEASHPYELQIDAGNIVRWNFNNILLPDSTTNEPESHGFIYFKIETKNNLIDSDQISNLAAIYFDFNDPILTNQVLTEIKDILINTQDLSTLTFTTELKPNPTSHSSRLIFELEKSEKLEISLFNELGQKVKSVLTPQILATGTHTIEFSLLSEPSGIYFLNIKTERGMKSIRAVKIE